MIDLVQNFRRNNTLILQLQLSLGLLPIAYHRPNQLASL